MTQKTFLTLAGGIFLAVALVHAARWLGHWEVVIAGWPVPQWASAVAAAVAGWLALTAFRVKGG